MTNQPTRSIPTRRSMPSNNKIDYFNGMQHIIETERFYLREFVEDDASHFYEMNNDEEVLRYTGDNPFQDLSEARSFINSYDEYKLHGMGRWAVCEKTSHSFVGWCGLKYHPSKEIVEVGYRFYRNFWNRGFATECARACVVHGFEELNLQEIYAHAHIDNLASHKVIENSGFQFVKETQYDNLPIKLFVIRNLSR